MLIVQNCSFLAEESVLRYYKSFASVYKQRLKRNKYSTFYSSCMMKVQWDLTFIWNRGLRCHFLRCSFRKIAIRLVSPVIYRVVQWLPIDRRRLRFSQIANQNPSSVVNDEWDFVSGGLEPDQGRHGSTSGRVSHHATSLARQQR